MRILLITLLVALFTRSEGRRYSLTPKAASLDPSTPTTTSKTTAFVARRKRSNYNVVEALPVSPEEVKQGAIRFIRLPFHFLKMIGRASMHGFVQGYVIGSVLSIYKLTKLDATFRRKHGLKQFHELANRWGNRVAKFYANVASIALPVGIVLLQIGPFLLQKEYNRGGISSELYRDSKKVLEGAKKKFYGLMD